jgi:uncharacterized membrane protein required for colicin V production
MRAEDDADRERDERERDDRQRAAKTLPAVFSQRACRTLLVTSVDWIIVAFAVALALLGFRQGLIVGVLSFAGFLGGAFVGTRIAPLVLPQGSSSPYAPTFGLFGALIGGGILAGAFEGLGLGLRRRIMAPGLGTIDGVLGALFGVALSLGIVWILAAVAAQSSGQSSLRADIQRSAILQKLNEILPPSGPILNALARLDPLPSIAGPSPGVPAPEARVAGAPGVRAASRSVVRIVGSACGLAIEGSGWVAAPDMVVTNAHVVAGELDTTVQVDGAAPGLAAQPIAFDTRNDVAVLYVRELGLPSLSMSAGRQSGTAGAVLGYPENGPFDAEPARIGRTQTVMTDNAYGQGPVPRLLTPLRGLVRPGNSGGPVVDEAGSVLTTVFAGTVGSGPRGGYGVADQTVAKVLSEASALLREGRQMGTGPCTGG